MTDEDVKAQLGGPERLNLRRSGWRRELLQREDNNWYLRRTCER